MAISIDKKIKINPYVKGLSLIKHRLMFDLNPFLLKNKQKIKEYNNKFQNQKCIIICNGPSLKHVDFDELNKSNIFTIGLNKINLLFDNVDFRPDAIACVNPHVIEQNMDFYLSTDIPLFLDFRPVYQMKEFKKAAKRPNLHLLHSADVIGIFAKDISMSICQGSTVTYVAMQIAYHMGFSKVAIIGCDHYFSSKGAANKLIQQKEVEDNHFIPNYFSPGSKWQLPDLVGSEFHYQIARDTFNDNGRELINCTAGGLLEILPRMELSKFLQL